MHVIFKICLLFAWETETKTLHNASLSSTEFAVVGRMKMLKKVKMMIIMYIMFKVKGIYLLNAWVIEKKIVHNTSVSSTEFAVVGGMKMVKKLKKIIMIYMYVMFKVRGID